MTAGEHLVVPCEQCGADYRQSRCDQQFCSPRCNEAAWRARRPRDLTRCPVCGSDVIAPQRTYCSAECRLAAESKRRKWPAGGPGKGWSRGTQTAPRQTCEVCGGVFYAPPAKILRSGGKFCSVGCYARFRAERPETFPQCRTKRAKTGKRADLESRFFRSSWEANYARYLNLLVSHGEIVKWEYEVDTFEFPVKRGSRFYMPDFKVWTSEDKFEYHEVKGYMDPKSATKLKRMVKYHPKTKIVLIDGPVYRSLGRTVSALLPHWEYSENGKRGY